MQAVPRVLTATPFRSCNYVNQRIYCCSALISPLSVMVATAEGLPLGEP